MDAAALQARLGLPAPLSPATAAAMVAANTDAHARCQAVIGSENVLRALLANAGDPDVRPRIIGWVADKIRAVRYGQQPLDALARCLDIRGAPLSGGGGGGGGFGGGMLPLSESMDEVFEIVGQIAGRPIQDGDTVIAGGIVASEFVVAAMMLHGVNNAAETLGYASSGKVNSWSILEAINVAPEGLLVTRRATADIEAMVLPAAAAAGPTVDRRADAFHAGQPLPSLDVGEFPASPTNGSNWLVPGRLVIGSHPNDADAGALSAAGVTTFVSLIGEYSTQHYHGRKYPRAAIRPASYIHFPVQDFCVPDPALLMELVLELKRRIVAGECVYVHCRGGHGRTGTVVIPLLVALYGIDLGQASRFVNMATLAHRADDRDRAAAELGYNLLPETEEQDRAVEDVTRRIATRETSR